MSTIQSPNPSKAFGKLPAADYDQDLLEAYFRAHYKYLNLSSSVPEYESRLIIKDRSISMVIRIINHISILKYRCIFSPTNFICSVYQMTLGGSTSSYGYLYSEYDPATSKFTPRYITTCPTFMSADGEYRHRLIGYSQFEGVLRDWADELEPIESVVVGALESGVLSTQVFSFYPKTFTGPTDKFDEQLRSSRIEITALISAFWCVYHYLSTKTSPNHINESFLAIVKGLGGLSQAFKESKKRLLDKGETEFIDRLKSFHQPSVGPLGWRAEAGQKLMVLSRADLINYHDLRYPCWREVYGNLLASELLSNYYTPCVPMFLQYYFVSNSNKLLFDNEPQHRRFINAEVTEDVMRLLRSADERNFTDPTSGAYRDPKFLALSNRIRQIMRTEGDAARVADTALGLLFEHTGRTIGDALILLEHGTVSDYAPMFLEDPMMFRKYMFEFIYTLYCFNYKQKLFHGDLHINNATIYRRVPKNRDMKIVYLVDDTTSKPQVYCLPYNGAFACIIDMSRCILGDVSRIARDYTPQYAKEFVSAQGDAIARMFNTSFPELYRKYSDRLMDAVRWKFEVAFKVLCAHDGYRLTNEIYSMLLKVQRDFNRLKIHPEILKIASGLRDDYADWYNRHLEALTNGELSTPDQVPWVHLEILTKHFELFRCTKPSDIDETRGELADVFSMMHPMDFNFRTYDQLSPLLKLDTVIEQKNLHGIDPSEEIGLVVNFKRDTSSSIVTLINYYRDQSLATPTPEPNPLLEV